MSINEEKVGLLKIAIIENVDDATNTIYVRFPNSENTTTWRQSVPTSIPITYPLSYNNGLFIGAKPTVGTQVVVGQGTSNKYYFVSFLDRNTNSPKPDDNEILIQASNMSKISLDADNEHIKLGSFSKNLNIVHNENVGDPGFVISNFNNYYSFTEGSRKTTGIIKRDLQRNENFDDFSKLTSELYENELSLIGLDPTASVNSSQSPTKNPPLVEDRELIYEFSASSNVEDDLNEAFVYGKAKNSLRPKYTLQNRHASKTDTLSLSLTSPNYLMETVKGTVVDIFGNILDLNRQPLPIGSENLTIKDSETTSKDKKNIFNGIKALHRKGIAFHFELNARKDLSGNNGTVQLPDIKSKSDYARNRSRFFLDIDKEGQFKLNIPASSETGNIPLLTRYENYSTFGDEDQNNPNKLIQNDDGKDIYVDSFASTNLKNPIFDKTPGVISIKDGDKPGTPLDRIDNVHIKHGTVYHDITNTCFLHQEGNDLFFGYQVGGQETINFAGIPKLETPVATEIFVSGDKKNAGGRSGQINLDGSIELNIGANTSDRQSMWLDTAGGIVGNIGKDLRQNSAVVSMDGNLILQVGTTSGISNDSRFIKQSNEVKGGVIDIRVFRSGGYAHLIRIDDNGVSVMTAGQLRMFSKGNMVLKSDSSVIIEGEKVIVQEREVLKNITGGSI